MEQKQLNREEIVAAIEMMQAQMKEMSKRLTVLKHDKALKDEPKPKAKAEPINYALSNDDLTAMSQFLKDELFKLGTVDKHLFPEANWEFLRELWHEYAPKSKNITYDLSQLWAKIRKFELGYRFKDFGGFRSYLEAA